MPGGDGNGPLGYGSKTGRGLGFCAGYNEPGYVKIGYGRRFGRGFGPGFGRRFWGRGRGFWRRGYIPRSVPYYDSDQRPSINDEKAYLEDTIKSLEEEIKIVRERLEQLSKEKKENP